jgi:hypothetical protein
MLCDNSNLTGIVDRLIAKKLVERRPDSQDRRVSLICLTPEGAEKLRNIQPRHHASVSRRMHRLSQEEMSQLRSLLHTLYQGLGDVLENEHGFQIASTNGTDAQNNGASKRRSPNGARGQTKASTNGQVQAGC